MQSRFENACLAEWIAPEKHKNDVLNWMKNGKNFLVLLGFPGVGKTYFCAALLNYFWDQGLDVHYTISRHFFQKIQEAIRENGNQYYVIQNLAEKEILIIDDIGAGTNTEWQQEMLLELIDLRYNSQKPTVITSNLKYDEIKEILGARIYSRLRASENLMLGMWEKDRRLMKRIEE